MCEHGMECKDSAPDCTVEKRIKGNCFKTKTEAPESPRPCASFSNDLLSARKVLEWLDGEIETMEYPIGSLGISREDRRSVVLLAKKAKALIKNMEQYGR